jgi:hypothetical protein
MRLVQIAVVALVFSMTQPAMAQERIQISSDWGTVAAALTDNAATRALTKTLPITMDMRDHLRQEKTGNLPSPLPEVPRQLDFATGDARALGTGSLRDLLPQRSCAPARNRDSRPGDRRRLDL